VDNAEIVAAIAAGELDGLAAALERHAGPLFGHCHPIAPGAAAEAVHDAFIVAWEQLGGLSDPDRLYPWLQTVAENECLRQMLIAGTAAAPAGTAPAGALPPELAGQVLSACADITPAGRTGSAWRTGPARSAMTASRSRTPGPRTGHAGSPGLRVLPRR
jgi:DNA-directed RNA polymerase specialized sigma24 family protein